MVVSPTQAELKMSRKKEGPTKRYNEHPWFKNFGQDRKLICDPPPKGEFYRFKAFYQTLKVHHACAIPDPMCMYRMSPNALCGCKGQWDRKRNGPEIRMRGACIANSLWSCTWYCTGRQVMTHVLEWCRTHMETSTSLWMLRLAEHSGNERGTALQAK